ncbi:MAG: hypothetical protein JWM62_144 [Frankiales bacterium]|jgi:uncharacterized protein (TIGR03083 family)|nr:hypothetical protein [Frankiales bacterium]
MELDHLTHLRVEARAFEEVLRADLAAPVAACPGWMVRDLALHLGAVHLWAAAVVRTGRQQDEPEVTVADDELADWYADCARGLLAELGSDPSRPAWTLTGAGTLAFWRRRQALETAVHRVDAQRAVGREQPVSQELAADGIGEVLDVMHPRQVVLARTPAPTAAVLLETPQGLRWTLGAGKPCAVVRGTASDLLLLLWHRRSRHDLEVEGDVRALDSLLAQRLTP